jgi:aminoglycoside phosphotransferase family enzyme/predicted kinase
LTFENDTVRKRKKAVRLTFLDLSTPRLRWAACRNEVTLNRRLSPDVYRGVEEVRDENGRLIDAVVVMRRLPGDRQLSTLIAADADVVRELDRTAHVLAAFHSKATRGPRIDRVATRAGLSARWAADLAELRPLVRSVLGEALGDRESRLVHSYIRCRTELLERRIAQGHIVDGHGDLRADSVFCLPDRPRIIDCLEFDARLRYGDELADVAFLAMDLESLGRPDLADRFVRSYTRFAGWIPPRLLHVYIAHRALVRSKVACWRVLEGETAAVSRVRLHLDQCRRHLEAARPLAIVIGGAPRTGKSTLARSLSDAVEGVHLRSDEVRRDVAGRSFDARDQPDPLDRGRYSPPITAATYRTLAARAQSVLRAGYSVILDATFPDSLSRLRIERSVRECGVAFVAIECRADPSIVRQRASRKKRREDLSEVTPALASVLQSRRDPWPAAHAIDTTVPAATLVRRRGRMIRETPLPPESRHERTRVPRRKADRIDGA